MTPRPERFEPPTWRAADAPTFAVVGKVNMGKSAVLATLLEEDDDAIIRISDEPGETTRCQRLSLTLDGVERLRFIDTPGFQQPIEALRAIRELAARPERGPGPGDLARFVERYADTETFVDECALLAPILEGAGVIYVVDPCVRLHDAFIAEIEILRLSAGPRLAVLNPKGETAPAYESAWRAELGKAFNLVRTFNAFAARFDARRELLAALNQIDERDRDHLSDTLERLDTEWVQRREEAAELIADCLARALTHTERTSYVDEATPETARRAALAEAHRRYFAAIADLERETTDRLLGVYRHRHTKAHLQPVLAEDIDLTEADTWQRFGLDRRQLTFAGAATGAAGVGWIDIATAGHTLGLATLFGGGVGGALAWFKGDALPSLNLSIGRRATLGGRALTVGPPKSPNFAWILFDLILLRYRAILGLTHAERRRDGLVAASGSRGAAKEGVVAQLPAERQKRLARWFKALVKDAETHRSDGEARAAIEATLAEIERRPAGPNA